MRLFKRKPKKCEVLSLTYNYLKPDEGVQLTLGIDEDKILPGLAKKEIAYHHFEVEELEWLVRKLQEIQRAYGIHSD